MLLRSRLCFLVSSLLVLALIFGGFFWHRHSRAHDSLTESASVATTDSGAQRQAAPAITNPLLRQSDQPVVQHHTQGPADSHVREKRGSQYNKQHSQDGQHGQPAQHRQSVQYATLKSHFHHHQLLKHDQLLKHVASTSQPSSITPLNVASTAHPASIIPLTINQHAILKNAPTLSPNALKAGLEAYQWSLGHTDVQQPGLLSIIDFDLPSYEKRLWLIDLNSSKVLMNLRTSQGMQSGLVTATHFSNRLGSHETSLGAYKTLTTYNGKHGLSMRLQGLQKGVNNTAYQRAVVVHPAPYVSSDFVNAHHRTGRSWGCFALSPLESRQFIDLTHNGSILYAYSHLNLDRTASF